MNEHYPGNRRGFLRTAFGAFSGAMAAAHAQASPDTEASKDSRSAALVGRVTLDRDIYDAGGILNGEIHFLHPPTGPIDAEWIDSLGRVVQALALPAPATSDSPLAFSLNLAAGLAYVNWIRIKVNGVPQLASKNFLLSPPRDSWDDFHVITWAHYNDGVYDKLRDAGIDGTIAGARSSNFSNVLDNNFRFYVEQMAWEVFSIYIKDRPLWYNVVNRFSTDRENLKLWVRKPCINDPKTDDYLRENLTRYVREHKAFRPLYYNIADELGQGWQIKANDFCHSDYCTAKFAQYLRTIYRTPNQLSGAWQTGDEFLHWDDENPTGTQGDKDLMIARTTTDGAFDAVAVAGLETRYGSIARLNQEWGTRLPEVSEPQSARQRWAPVISVIREARGAAKLDEKSLEQKIGTLEALNERAGRTAEKPADFRTWAEVLTFVSRFYAELPKVNSTDGWNVTAWCDFRNFMDQTFADAVLRAAKICKAEDPNARCATEGGQSPFPFGWYNYEQVLRADDVIEPYNGGNNVEVIRSLKPSTIMIHTVGYQYTPGKQLTDRDRLIQNRGRRPVWWSLFHAHRGTLIWDANLPDYQFVDPKTRQFTPAAKTYSGVFNELRSGIGKLFVNAQRTHDGVAIHYSPPSDQIHWLLDNTKYARQWMLHNGSDRGSHAIAVRNSWTKLIEDLGLQYEFTSPEMIKAGKLNSGDYRVFIMPKSIAVGPEEVRQIREFENAGGLVIADYRTARMNEHGRDHGHGQLDDLFGISRGKGQTAGQTTTGVGNEGSLHLEGRPLQLRVGDESITTTTGKALAHSGGVPLIIVNRAGRGRTVFLNLEMSDYAYDRLQPDSKSSLPDLLESILALAEVHPRVRVLGDNGKRLPGVEITIFKNGPLEHVAIFRNPQFDDGGWEDHPTMKAPGWAGSIDNSLLEKDAEVTIEWKGARHAYDMRGRKELGVIESHKATLSPWEPLIFTLSTQPIPKLTIEVAPQLKAGAQLEIMLTSEAIPAQSFRVVRLEVETPAGKSYELYERNLKLNGLPHRERIPLAHNDPKGCWRISIRDVMTGHSQQVSFNVV